MAIATWRQDPKSWKTEIRDWLTWIQARQYEYFPPNLQRAAHDLRSHFPHRAWLKWLVTLSLRTLAMYAIRVTIVDAAKELGWQISDETVDLLAEVAFDSLVSV